MEVLPEIDTAAIANSLSRVTKDFSFDPESFSKESNNLLSLIRNQIKAAVDSSKESLTTRDNKLKEILRKYETLLKDCKGYCNSFLQETEKMRVLLDQWKNAVLIEKSLEDVTFWLQTRLAISDEQLLMKIKKLLLDDGITSIKDISDLEDEQLDAVIKKMPIGKQKTLKDKIAELKVDLQDPNQAQRLHQLLLCMQQIHQSSENSKKNLLSIGERYQQLVQEIEEEAKHVQNEQDKQFWTAVGVGVLASALTLGCVIAGCACPILIVGFGYGLMNIMPVIGTFIALGTVSTAIWKDFASIQEIRDRLQTMEVIYAGLSKKIQIEENLWSEITKYFCDYTNMVGTVQNTDVANILKIPQSIQSFEADMHQVSNYLKKLNSSINQYLTSVESKHWEYLQTMLIV